MKKPLIIGITGGIGVGKSLVSRVFASLGIPVYDADSRAKWLITNDLILRAEITQLLGEQAYTPAGEYNRSWVASRVFGNVELLQQLNALVHPSVKSDARQWFASHVNAPFLLYEAALINAAAKQEFLDKILVVTASLTVRMKRIRRRDERSDEEIRAIIARQLSDEERLSFADFVIDNDENTAVLPQVLALHASLKAV